MKAVLAFMIKILAVLAGVFLAMIIAVRFPSILSAFHLGAWMVGGVYITAREIKKIR